MRFLNETEVAKFNWLEERKNFIGASEVASVMELDTAYESRDDLLTRKILRVDAKVNDFITRKGTNAEPIIQAMYESRQETACKTQVIYSNDKLPYLRATIDAETLEGRIVEFKLVGRVAFERAQNDGYIPPHHEAQLQAQMFCAKKTDCHYVAYNEEAQDIVILERKYDQEFAAKMIDACIKFKAEWESGVLPKPKTKEVLNNELIIALNEIEANKQIIKNLTAKNDDLQYKIEEFLGGTNAKIGQYKCEYVERKGSVDYDRYFKTSGIDKTILETFRKASTKYLKISVDKK